MRVAEKLDWKGLKRPRPMVGCSAKEEDTENREAGGGGGGE
jgi:hypothetical protein